MRKTSAPGNINGRFIDYDPQTQTSGTTINSQWLNDVQDDLIAVQEAAGIPEGPGSEGKLRDAIQALIAAGNVDKLDGYDYTDILNAAIPIGFVYTQWPNDPSPATLWPWATWENVSPQYAGLFARVEGTYDADHVAAAFGSGVQMDDNKSHQHNTMDGPLYNGAYISKDYVYVGSGGNSTAFFTSDPTKLAKTSLSGGTEARPINITVRVWKRTL